MSRGGRFNREEKTAYNKYRSYMSKRDAKAKAAKECRSKEGHDRPRLQPDDSGEHPVLRKFLPQKYGFEVGYLKHGEQGELEAALAAEYDFPKNLLIHKLVVDELLIPRLKKALSARHSMECFLKLNSPSRTLRREGLRDLIVANDKALLDIIRNVEGPFADYAKKLQTEAFFGGEEEAEREFALGNIVAPKLSFREALLGCDLEQYGFEPDGPWGRTYRKGDIAVTYDGDDLIGIYFGCDETPIEEIDGLDVSEESGFYDPLSGRMTDKAFQYLASMVTE